jgi:hypothetical protein
LLVQDGSNDFRFIVGDHLSPRVSKLHWIDATISEQRREVEDADDSFISMLEAATL